MTEAASADEPNTITLYDKKEVIKYYDPTTGKEVAEADRLPDVEYKEVSTIETTPKYYTVSLKQTEYGDKTEPSAKPMYFKWVDVDGNKQLTQDGASASDYDVVYYAKTQYGNPNGDTTLTYGWKKNTSTNNLEFKKNPSTPVEPTITYKYNSSDTQTRLTNSTDNSSKTTTGVFVGQTTGSTSGSQYGGAIYNNGSGAKLDDINADFIGNYARGNSSTYGGAIYNDSGIIGDFTGNFVGNYVQGSYSGYGGAIYNYASSSSATATIGNITGDFIGNHVLSTGTGSAYAYGGAISNNGAIGNITGNLIRNYTFANSNYRAQAFGGAIVINQDGTIKSINSNFIANYAYASSLKANPFAYGGAIYNRGNIDSISGDFVGNFSSTSDINGYVQEAGGGSIYNLGGTIGNITGDFLGNYSSSENAYGGAIFNDSSSEYFSTSALSSTIGNITGNFIGNYTEAGADDAYGGAIYNGAKKGTAIIGNITGDFIANYSISTNKAAGAYAGGGAIYNIGITGDIVGDFISNYAKDSNARGGAIYNQGTIGNIIGNFVGNYVQSGYYAASGGAISNGTRTIESITGDFIGNYAQPIGDSAYGGAIYNSGTIGDITGDFMGNYVQGSYSCYAGAIYNFGTIGDNTGDFIGNYTQASSYAYGGAIYNSGTIGDFTGDFVGNYAQGSYSGYGGAIYNYASSSSATATIGNITGDFIGNYAQSDSQETYGGAIYNYASSSGTTTIGNIMGDFIDNYAQSNSTGSYSYAYGGAIYNYAYDSQSTATIGLTNNNFLNNHAISQTGADKAKGGAIFTNYDMTLNADNGTSLISGNYTESNGVKENNAIYVANLANSSGTIQRNTTLTLNAVNNGKIQIDDTISGGSYYQSSNKFWETSEHAYNLALTGDGTGTISLYNDVENAKVTANNVTVDLANNETRDYNFVSMTANDTKLNIDVNLTDKTADTISTLNQSTGTLIVNSINTIGSTDDAVKIQIIKNTDTSSDLQLKLGDNFHIVDDILDTVTDSAFNDDIYMQEDGINVATTNTINDSLIIYKDKIYDTLDLITTKESENERNFTFRTTDNYIASKDLGTTTKGTLNINGLGTTTPSTIDANNHTMFDLRNETTLNISNTTIKNAKDFVIKAENANSVVNLTNASFKDTQGTAIQSNVDVNITANGAKSEFSGNTQAIQMNNADKTINMNSVNSGEIVLSDIIDGTQGYSIKLDGDNKSKITLNNNINNANIYLDNTNLYLSKENLLDNSQALTLNSGSMYLNNDAIGTMHLPTLNLAGTTNLSVDVDLANETMDRITADTYNITNDALLNVNNLTLLSTTEKDSVKILFADKELANNVAYTGESPTSYKGTNTIYSPIYKYNVTYATNPDDKLGYFFFNRTGSGSGGNTNPSDAYNPAVLTPSVATQAGAYATQMQTFNYAFQHSDNFMNIPYLERVAIIEKNKYARRGNLLPPLNKRRRRRLLDKTIRQLRKYPA